MIKAYAARAAGGRLEPFEYDPGDLGPEQVEIDVLACGICHSDLSMLENDWQIAAYPFVPGHEVVGRVAAIGDRVQHLKVGDTVGLGWFCGSCMTCAHCMAGDHNLCAANEQTIVGRHGGFADKVRCKAEWAIAVAGGSGRPEGRTALLRRHHRLQPHRPVRGAAHRPGGGDRHRRPGAPGPAVPQQVGLRGHRLHLQRRQAGAGPGDGRAPRRQLPRRRPAGRHRRLVRLHPLDGQRGPRLGPLLRGPGSPGPPAHRGRRSPRPSRCPPSR